jgi:hypothetical protein
MVQKRGVDRGGAGGGAARADAEYRVGRVDAGASAARSVASVLALQRSTGNRAVARLLQRAPPGTSALAVKTTAVAKGFRRGLTRAQELRQIADKLIEEELGSRPASLGARRNGLAEIARRGGARAETARRLRDGLARVEADLEKRASDVASVSDDLIEEQLGARPKTPEARERALSTLRERGGEAGEQSELLEKELGEIETELTARKPAKALKFAATAENTATKAGDAGVKASAEAEGAVAPEGAAEVAAEGSLRAGAVATALEVVFNPALLLQWEILKGIAGDYQQAWNRIREPARHIGFAQGWVASLVGLDRAWIRQNLAPKFIDTTDVGVEVVGGTGMSEEAYVEGLSEGFRYGEGYSMAARNKPLERAYAAIRDRGEQVDFDPDDKRMTPNSLILVAAVLQPEADDAMHRWAELREQRHRRAIDEENAKYASRPDSRPL